MSGRDLQDAKNQKYVDEHVQFGSEYTQSFIRYLKSRRKSPATQKVYLLYLFQYERFLNENNLNVLQVKPMDIDKYIEYISHSNGSQNGVSIINTKLAAMTSFYNFLLDNDFVIKNPCLRKKLKQEQKKDIVYLDEKEEEILKIQTKNHDGKWHNRDYSIICIGLSTGMRVSEIINIDVEDIDFDNKVIKNIRAKGNKMREIPIGDNTLASIKIWLQDRDRCNIPESEHALFVSQRKNRISRRSIAFMLERGSIDFNKHITPHKMRSTCATRILDKTGNIALAADRLGHANLETTRFYARINDDKARNLAKILD